jgi:hypothetical protein
MLVIQADRGGTFRETFSMAKAYTEARREHGAGQLLDDLVSEKPQVDRTRAGSQEEMRSNLLQHVREAVTLLARKATPEEVEEYRGFVMKVGNRVAEAHREGDEQVSEPEHQALAEISEAAGGAPSS